MDWLLSLLLFACRPYMDGQICEYPDVRVNGRVIYPKPVAIIRSHPGDPIEQVFLHLHGYQVCHTPERTRAEQIANDFDLYPQLRKVTTRPFALVVPLSSGRVTEFQSHLVPNFGEFAAWVVQQTGRGAVPWWVTGHSAAGFIIHEAFGRRLDTLAPVQGVVLLDATYSTTDASMRRWRAIASHKPSLRVLSVYKPGTATERGHARLREALPSNMYQFETTVASHCSIPKSWIERWLKRVF